jgi:hypothetical protein
MTAPQTTVSVAPDIGVPGQLADFQGMDDGVIFSKTSKEASATIPFGVAVKQGTLDDDVLLMTAAANKLAGVVVWANDFAIPSELVAAGLTPGTTFGVLFDGPILVTVEDAVTPASGVHIRFSANGGNVQPGAFRGTADATHTIDASAFCRYLTSAGAGGTAVVYVNFANAALAVAD